LSRNHVIYESATISLYKALMGLVQDRGLDQELAKDIFHQARKRYNENPYTTAIIWGSPLDDEGERRLVQRFRLEIGRWLEHHQLDPGLVDVFYVYLREEIREQISATSVRHMAGPIAMALEDAPSQLISA
jgi:hypothetical protein